MSITHFENVNWLVAWDPQRESHVYLRDADLVIEADRIIHVGGTFEGASDKRIDGSMLCLIPGFVDIHAHPASEVFYRGIREDHSVREHYMSGLFERSCAYRINPQHLRYGGEVSYADLMRSGVTTLVDNTFPYPGWQDLMQRSGLRVYAAPGFNTSRWYRDNAHQLKYAEDLAAGEQQFRQALNIVDELSQHPSGLLRGVIAPFQIDNNTEATLRKSYAAARERGVPWTTHAAQAVLEHQTIVERHGVTPIQLLHKLDLLGPGTIIAHAITHDQSSWVRWHTNRDIELLGESKTAIAHCPTPFMRYGTVLEHFGKYRDAGVVIGIGTDTIPHNIIEDMRYAAILARVASRDGHIGTTADVFNAATVGGAEALGREDLGRLEVGAKADIVVVDLEKAIMQPVRDPIVSLVHSAAERAVKDVYIDGRQVVRDREVLTLDREGAAAAIREFQVTMEAATVEHDYLKRSSEQISPLSFPVVTQA